MADRARAHAFVEDLDRPVLSDGDRHHLERVLRLRPGEVVTVSDGAGRWRRCRFGPDLDPVGAPVAEPAPAPAITVALAVGKGERPDWAVQKLTEVGVDEIVLLATARAVVRWEGERGDRHLDRLRRVAREAAVQSRRVWLPSVSGVEPFAAVAARAGACLAERGGEPPTLERPVVLIGPEGGWDPAERAAGPPFVSLGPTVLRTETAAVAAGVLLVALREKLAIPPRPGSDE